MHANIISYYDADNCTIRVSFAETIELPFCRTFRYTFHCTVYTDLITTTVASTYRTDSDSYSAADSSNNETYFYTDTISYPDTNNSTVGLSFIETIH